MASRYASVGTQNTAADSALTVIGATTVKGRIYYLKVSASVAVADAIVDFSVRQFTAVGTGTGVTPEPLDVDDRVALCSSDSDHSAEPTYAGINVLDIGLNQRSVFQWYAQEGGELVTKKAANAGWGVIIDAFSAGTPAMLVNAHWAE